MRHWLVQLGPEGIYLTDFATFRTGVGHPDAVAGMLNAEVVRWANGAQQVGDQVRAHVMKLPHVA